MSTDEAHPAGRHEWRLALALFVVLLGLHGWAMAFGWRQANLPGNEFRQAQTALSTLFIQRDNDYSLAYPTPVLGQPWSVPMEFPLYQWTVAKLSDWTGLPLLPTGRLVSALCFYVALAALFPLLGALSLTPARRLVVMGLVLTSPVYIFYSRSFLIETMALMLSLWFLVAFGRMIVAPTFGRLLLVTAFGVPAGLVKVTTFMVFLILAGVWTLIEMGRQQVAGGWPAALRRAPWALGAIAVPLLLTAWWTRFADAVKHRNPVAAFLDSGSLLDFNFGTNATRFSDATLGAHWRNISHTLAGPVLLIVALVFALTIGRKWWRQIAFCLGCFLATLALFPTLYAFHDYYAMANGMLLLGGLGVAMAASLDLRPRWLPWTLLIAVHATQAWAYRVGYFDMQYGPLRSGNELTQAIARITTPEEMIVVTGDDWNSSIPFLSGRRALMIRNGMERDAHYLNMAFAAQAGARVGILVLRNTDAQEPGLLQLAGKYFGIDPKPLFRWRDMTAYGPARLRPRLVHSLRETPPFLEIELPEETPGPWPPVDQDLLLDELLPRERGMFAMFSPLPWKYNSQHGATAADEAGRRGLFSHPRTTLWFRVPAGPHVFRAQCVVQATAYAGIPNDWTDGVEFLLEAEQPDGTRTKLTSLLLRPGQHPEEQGWRTLEWRGEVAGGTSLVLSTTPGPANNLTRDWAVIGPVEIK